MAWQDLVFTVGQWIFAISLIPTIRAKEKPALATSTITAIILTTFGFTYFTFHLWLSGISAFVNATAWSIVAVQKYRKDHSSK